MSGGKLPNKQKGDSLHHSHVNEISRAYQLAGQIHPSTEGAGGNVSGKRVFHEKFKQRTFRVQELISSTEVDEDGNEPIDRIKAVRRYATGPFSWADDYLPEGQEREEGEEEPAYYYLDADPMLLNPEVGDIVSAYWHAQRKAWVPIAVVVDPDDDTEGGVSLAQCCSHRIHSGSVELAADPGIDWAFRYSASLGVLGEAKLVFDEDLEVWLSPLLKYVCSSGEEIFYRAKLEASGHDAGDAVLTVEMEEGIIDEDRGEVGCCDPQLDPDLPTAFKWVFTNCCHFDPLQQIKTEPNLEEYEAFNYCEEGPCAVCLVPQVEYIDCSDKISVYVDFQHVNCTNEEDERRAFSEKMNASVSGFEAKDCGDEDEIPLSLEYDLVATDTCLWLSVPTEQGWSENLCKNDKNSDPFLCQPCYQDKGDFIWKPALWMVGGVNLEDQVSIPNEELPESWNGGDVFMVAIRWAQFRGELADSLVDHLDTEGIERTLAIYDLKISEWDCTLSNELSLLWEHPDSAATFPQKLILKRSS